MALLSTLASASTERTIRFSQAEIQALLRVLNPETVDLSNPLVAELRRLTYVVFGILPCLWQLRVSLAVLKRDRDVICIAGTGSGKTITFWMLLFLLQNSIVIVISPLNVLGKQNVDELNRAEFPAVHVYGETATKECFEDIERGKFRVVVTNPEIITRAVGGFSELFKQSVFRSRICAVIFDEAHTVKQWGAFRPEFLRLGFLRYHLKNDGIDIPFLVTSATLPTVILNEVSRILMLRTKNIFKLRRSIDRANVSLALIEIQRGQTASFKDAVQVLFQRGWKSGDKLPPKYLFFGNTINDTQQMGLAIQNVMPVELSHLTGWVCSEMSNDYQNSSVEDIRNGEAHGRAATDSCGMGLNLPNIGAVGQWKAGVPMTTAWQRFGRAARDPNTKATAILFAESKHFDISLRGKYVLKGSFQNFPEPSLTENASDRLENQDVAPLIPERAVSNQAQADDGPISIHSHVESQTIDNIPQVLDTVPLTGQSHVLRSADRNVDAPADFDEYRKGRKTEYEMFMKEQMQASTSGHGHGSKNSKNTEEARRIDPSMNDMVNAQIRPHKCMRWPALCCLDEDLLRPSNDHLLCRPDLPNGCDRCHHSTSKPFPCCPGCHPDEFAWLYEDPPMSTDSATNRTANETPPNARVPIPDSPSLPTRSRILKQRDRTSDRYVNIKNALKDWRDVKFAAMSSALCNFLGPDMVLPSTVLDRICDCADEGRITTLTQLKVETSWAKSDHYGTEIIALVSQHCPPLPPKKSKGNSTQRTAPLAGPSRTANTTITTTATTSTQAQYVALQGEIPIFSIASYGSPSDQVVGSSHGEASISMFDAQPLSAFSSHLPTPFQSHQTDPTPSTATTSLDHVSSSLVNPIATASMVPGEHSMTDTVAGESSRGKRQREIDGHDALLGGDAPAANKKTRKAVTCSVCKLPGHRRDNRKCALFGSTPATTPASTFRVDAQVT